MEPIVPEHVIHVTVPSKIMHRVIILASFTLANPWHSGIPRSDLVNDFDLNGQQCKPNYQQVICPPVCVDNPEKCPASLLPDTCPQGSYYCRDGECHAGPSKDFACYQIKSKCNCAANPASADLYPCAQKQTLSFEYSAKQNQLLLAAQCATAANLSLSPTSSIKYCAPVEAAPVNWISGVFVTFYFLAAAEFFLIAHYLRYKQKKYKLLLKSNAQFAQDYTSYSKTENQASQSIRFTGYREEAYGTLVKISVIGFSVVLVMMIFVLIADYYAVFAFWKNDNSSGLLFGDHNNLSKVFIVFWHLSALWFAGLQINKGMLKSMFLTQTDLSEATCILVEKARQAPVRFDEMGRLAELAQDIEQWFRNYTNTNISRELKYLETTRSGRVFIEFECVRYIYNPKTICFEPYMLKVGGKNEDLHKLSSGLDSRAVNDRLELSGPNEILFTMMTFWEGMVKEFSGIFYLYQFIMLQIWYFYAYYYMAAVLTMIIIGSGVVKVIVANTAQQRVLEMAKFEGNVKVFRDNRWTEIPSRELVVGDLMEITANRETPLSVDCVILKGDVVVDESSLTGEALPVTKFAIKNDSVSFAQSSNKKNCLFAGTMVLETQRENTGDLVIAVVLSTGGSTEKGKLVRDILYPVPFSFVFNEHLKIVFLILICWGITMLILSIGILKTTDVGSWFYGMFGISQVLSPILPAVLIIGQSVSSERLRAKGIMCVDLDRITLAGKVKVFCFDKTGTLTKEGVEFMGVHEASNQKFGQLTNEFSLFSSSFQMAMQTCHSISLAQGMPVGNFVDIEMFNSSRARIDEKSSLLIHSPLSSGPLRIIKRYEFNHAHAYMSSICQDTVTNQTHVFVKGSYEKILGMAAPQSIPADYLEVAKSHSSKGYYVLAVATRKINLTAEEVARADRNELEAGVEFLGLLLFRNELKPDTAQALELLRDGGCRNVMITGDNPNTAVFIAKASGMLGRCNQGVLPLNLIADVVEGEIEWSDIDTSFKWETRAVEQAIQLSRDGGQKVELIIAGKSFNLLYERSWFDNYLSECRVFARMSPLDKVHCVRLHMTHHITAMCGDGGNDAGALKASHAGIALTGSGSSVVSHFSSTNLSIMSCVELLREARCSLDVSIASYKILIMYGEILAFSGLIQYYFMIQMSQALWIFIDASTVPLSWALTSALPAAKLVNSRPTARLLGFETIGSVIGQLVINIIFLSLTTAILFGQSFFVCKEFSPWNVDLRKWWELSDNFESAALGIVTAFQVLNSSCAFSLGVKYRQGFFKNKTYLAIFGALFALLAFVLLADPNPVGCAFHINCGTEKALTALGYNVYWKAPLEYYSAISHNVFPFSFRITILLIVLANLLSIMIWEGVVVQGPVRDALKAFAGGRWQVKKREIVV